MDGKSDMVEREEHTGSRPIANRRWEQCPLPHVRVLHVLEELTYRGVAAELAAGLPAGSKGTEILPQNEERQVARGHGLPAPGSQLPVPPVWTCRS